MAMADGASLAVHMSGVVLCRVGAGPGGEAHRGGLVVGDAGFSNRKQGGPDDEHALKGNPAEPGLSHTHQHCVRLAPIRLMG